MLTLTVMESGYVSLFTSDGDVKVYMRRVGKAIRLSFDAPKNVVILRSEINDDDVLPSEA